MTDESLEEILNSIELYKCKTIKNESIPAFVF